MKSIKRTLLSLAICFAVTAPCLAQQSADELLDEIEAAHAEQLDRFQRLRDILKDLPMPDPEPDAGPVARAGIGIIPAEVAAPPDGPL